MVNQGIVMVGSYVTVLVQIGMLGAWPVFGGQPHLIAVGAAVFLVLHRPLLGLWWIVCGGALIDLLLPFRFGITLLPLLFGYGACFVLLRWAIDGAAWWSTVLVGMVVVFVTELPLALSTGSWEQLVYDCFASVIILVPISIILGYLLAPVRSGLRIGRA